MDERRKPNAPAGQQVDENMEHTEVRQLEDFGHDHPGPDPGGRFPIPSSDQDQGQPVDPSQANPRRRRGRRLGEAAG
jgi:hypothetical protein